MRGAWFVFASAAIVSASPAAAKDLFDLFVENVRSGQPLPQEHIAFEQPEAVAAVLVDLSDCKVAEKGRKGADGRRQRIEWSCPGYERGGRMVTIIFLTDDRSQFADIDFIRTGPTKVVDAGERGRP